MGTVVYAGGNTNRPLDLYAAGQVTVTTDITAEAAGTQAAATLLTSAINSVDTVAGAADGIKLPLAQAGLEIFVVNNTATSMQVFGSGTDTINNVVTATGVAQAAGISAIYKCVTTAPAGKWYRVLSA